MPNLSLSQVRIGPVGTSPLPSDNVNVIDESAGPNAFDIRGSHLPTPANAIIKFYGYNEGIRHGESVSVTIDPASPAGTLIGTFTYAGDGGSLISTQAVFSAHIRRRGGVDFDERAVEATLPASTRTTFILVVLLRKLLRLLYPKW